MKCDVSVCWGVGRGVVALVDRGVVDEVDSGVGNEGGELVELEVGDKVVSINI